MTKFLCPHRDSTSGLLHSSPENANHMVRYVVCVQLNTDWTQVEVITLVNDGTGLGFGIIGGKSTGVVVKTILPGGVADRVNNSLPGSAAVVISNIIFLSSSTKSVD